MQRTTLGYVGSLLVFCDILLVLTGYEIPRGCMVERTSISVEPIEFDSVDFHVHISHSGSNGSLGKLFEARLECKDNSYLNYDIITVADENVLLEINRDEINRGERNKTFPLVVPRFQEGWTKFSLGFVKHYFLQGTGGHLWWAHNDSSTDCHVVKVEVNGFLLMRYCPSQEVSWRVSDREWIDVPLFINSGNSNTEHLILYSSEDFYPKMKLDEWEFWIGMDANAMAIKKEREDRPLPSFTEHHLVLLFRESKNNSTEIRIMSENRELSSQAVKQKPRHLKVLKGGNASYFLTQRQRSTPDNEVEIIPSHPANPSDTIWILSGVLGLCCVVITVQLTWQLRLYWTFKRKISTTEGTVNRRRLNGEDHLDHVQISAPWGHPTLPLPASPPPPTPLSFRGPSRPPLPRGRVVLQERQRSPEEHAYYEMLPFATGILAKANVADVEDSAETVNDIYESTSE
ncbi:uncharacterized protein LOC135201050 [Macrobrachium nipponense]|uniref:uncharacterized protein LOC135201050 n=1 Tax=Macrobrachium nipponense TaxID=159736 RepID=UPI0030C8D32F